MGLAEFESVTGSDCDAAEPTTALTDGTVSVTVALAVTVGTTDTVADITAKFELAIGKAPDLTVVNLL